MTMNAAWQDLYKAALLELRPEELRQSIEAANKAIQQRIAELKRSDSRSADEAQAIDDALRGLHVLASTECNCSRPAYSDLSQGEATS